MENGKLKIIMQKNSQFSTLNSQLKKGQTLVMLLVFIAVATAITTAAVTLIISSGKSVTSLKEGGDVFKAAESAAENAYLRLLRNPFYTGETLTIDGATTVSTVTGSDTKTITAVAIRGNHRRSVVVTAGYTGGIFSVQSWVEAP